MTMNALKLGVCVGVVLIGKAALAQDGSGGSHSNSAPAAAAAAPSTTAVPWGPVATQKKSLVNMEPWVLPFFNNAPVFGVPGTITGTLAARTQLTGEWAGARRNLAEHGWFFDSYT